MEDLDDLLEPLQCPECGEMVESIEIECHGGVCKCCYDDFHFGAPEFDA